MVKISAEVVQDAISRNGRLIGISWKTDDEIINSLIATPRVWRQTFSIGTSNLKVRNSFKTDVSSIINSVKEKLTEEGLRGKKFEVEV